MKRADPCLSVLWGITLTASKLVIMLGGQITSYYNLKTKQLKYQANSISDIHNIDNILQKA